MRSPVTHVYQLRNHSSARSAVYNNTQSTIKFLKKEYTAEVGMRIEKVLAIAADRLESDLKESEQFQETGLGNYLLEGGVSDDKQFAVFGYIATNICGMSPLPK